MEKNIGVIYSMLKMEDSKTIFKLASIFLHYPSKEWVGDEEIIKAIHSIGDNKVQQAYSDFVQYTANHCLTELCETYVNTFDFNDKTTLYLTYDVFGDNRERGQAFVKLRFEFAKEDFYIKNDELPDFFPLILEFASESSEESAMKMFNIHRKSIDRLQKELTSLASPYEHVLNGCILAIDSLIEQKQAG
ncbi:nitrate reductase molybdenum cofactor assembly chaperone [Bacillus sp. SCS-151]|uniref:nitrate reductase molybdenum cofactor assembly chaperone n=1 Tax=Nanhaiella sioensis TaxID=3115293 RepID=UPI00397AC165